MHSRTLSCVPHLLLPARTATAALTLLPYEAAADVLPMPQLPSYNYSYRPALPSIQRCTGAVRMGPAVVPSHARS
jgi:hypothetical protein